MRTLSQGDLDLCPDSVRQVTGLRDPRCRSSLSPARAASNASSIDYEDISCLVSVAEYHGAAEACTGDVMRFQLYSQRPEPLILCQFVATTLYNAGQRRRQGHLATVMLTRVSSQGRMLLLTSAPVFYRNRLQHDDNSSHQVVAFQS